MVLDRLGFAAGDLVVAEHLQELDVPESSGAGLRQPGFQGVDHPGQLQGAQRLLQCGVDDHAENPLWSLVSAVFGVGMATTVANSRDLAVRPTCMPMNQNLSHATMLKLLLAKFKLPSCSIDESSVNSCEDPPPTTRSPSGRELRERTYGNYVSENRLTLGNSVSADKSRHGRLPVCLARIQSRVSALEEQVRDLSGAGPS